ncbi:Glycoside hydrolase family 31 protein [Venustampulla echinocandica]|uniref:Glycoside hydrolase family 31 protein n=1 Tax=Venustampulla echinocandica TaxID=2656787 RepID=A0A370TT69_9HELO|nr:Glycoside hydrolase family 31 protein [Venustampulla echinocandica]RDL38731.1 Glycoside hydrolase family 31 protein [Venustampulla echinocandica]
MKGILRASALFLGSPCMGIATASLQSPDTYSIRINTPKGGLIDNDAILAGKTNDTTSAVPRSSSAGTNGVQITQQHPSSQILKVQVSSSNHSAIGARFTTSKDGLFYGVWEYPFSNQLTNQNITFDLKGIGNAEGINWASARAPFFISTDGSGYGVYIDTLAMGSFSFSSGQAQFIFNTSNLLYYIIQPDRPGDYKSIITQYTALSARIEMPPDSGYGPIFWSDDFEQDFHEGVTNAEENYYDVVNHLYSNKIRATAMFADRPYGTGNWSFGNFDFDPKYYPNPKEFIANLSASGFDLQVWVANRAFLYTELYNVSVANSWLFTNQDPHQYLGPALNLSIPAAYDYFKEHLKAFTNLGVKGYKIDRGEEDEMPVYEQNIQMGLFEQICYDNMVEKWGKGNFYNFARSAVDRSRAVTHIWNGDSHSDFTGLAYSVSSGIRAGLLGYSMWGSDTGGYSRGPDDPSEELWARWMHFSAFSTNYEIMVGSNHTPWYSPYTPRLVNVLQQTAQLHTELVPYIKSSMYQSTKTGVPVMRALLLEFPQDKKGYEITDEYSFGDAFLVAPIVSEGGKRDVYFPTGNSYLDYPYTNASKVYAGGSTRSFSMELENSPTFVREGAIVARGDIFQGNAKWEKKWEPWLEIEIFPSWNIKESVFEYYSAGKRKDVAEISVQMIKEGNSVKIEYDDLGTKGMIVVHGKGRDYTYKLERGGGEVVVRDFDSLFGR